MQSRATLGQVFLLNLVVELFCIAPYSLQNQEIRLREVCSLYTSLHGVMNQGWSSAPASADLSAPQEGVAGVMVAAVGSLQALNADTHTHTLRPYEL
eukprot:2763113-Amphidinium_carterae.1